MNTAVYNQLIELAREGNNITYQNLSDQCRLGLIMTNPDHRNQIAALLGQISTTEHQHGRPLISVLVFRDDRNLPGDGFFELARRLGKYNGSTNPTTRDEFFVAEFRAVCDYWQNPR